jgi:hypothetical protein
VAAERRSARCYPSGQYSSLPFKAGNLFRSSREPEGLGFSGAEQGLARESAARSRGLAVQLLGLGGLTCVGCQVGQPLVGDGQVLLVAGGGGGEPLSDAQGLTV